MTPEQSDQDTYGQGSVVARRSDSVEGDMMCDLLMQISATTVGCRFCSFYYHHFSASSKGQPAVSEVCKLLHPHVQAQRHAVKTWWDGGTKSCPQCLFSGLSGCQHSLRGELLQSGYKKNSNTQDDVISHIYGSKMKKHRARLRGIDQRIFNSLLTKGIVLGPLLSTAQQRKCCPACSSTLHRIHRPISTCV